MADQKAYSLRANVENFSGGSVAIGLEGHTLDLGAALEKGDFPGVGEASHSENFPRALRSNSFGPQGVIVTDHELVQAALETPGLNDVFKSVNVPEQKASRVKQQTASSSEEKEK